MRIEITEVLDPDERLVHFRSAFGAAVGRLCGEKPLAQGAWDVELDVPDSVTDWKMGTEGESAVAGGADGKVRLSGKIASVDVEDNVVTLRVGSDLVLVEVVDLPVGDLVGAWISITAEEVHLYDMNL
jgi:hypothetical protein